jgi:hypothetical protein
MPDGGVEIRPPFRQYSRNARKNGSRIREFSNLADPTVTTSIKSLLCISPILASQAGTAVRVSITANKVSLRRFGDWPCNAGEGNHLSP